MIKVGNVKKQVSCVKKVLAVIATVATVMMMSRDAFAATYVDASGNVYNLYRYSSYAVAETIGNDAGWYCAVTVTAFNGNVGNSNVGYGYAYAGANATAPSSNCTSSTSTHNASKNGIQYKWELRQ